MTPMTTSITTVAEAFFDACETGKGWEVCSTYCTPEATFSAQAEPLWDVKTLAQYTDWMKRIMTVLPDAYYEVKSFATDSARGTTLPLTAYFMGPTRDRAGRFLRRAVESARITCT